MDEQHGWRLVFVELEEDFRDTDMLPKGLQEETWKLLHVGT